MCLLILMRLKPYLASSAYIDWQHLAILTLAKNLAANQICLEGIAQMCFEFVRDYIKHSWDYQLNPITCKASDVLRYGTGLCYAKSHLLAALLRANGIPAGICYQRLAITEQPSFCLHALNALYLEPYGWYRVDARGNKPGINAQFCPPVEQLAFALVKPQECDIPAIWAEPHPKVIEILTSYSTLEEVRNHLPDIESAGL